MRAHSIKTDNAKPASKISLRKMAIEGLDEVKVLDLFAGTNFLWSKIPTDRYYGVELVKGKGRNAEGDNLKIIPSLDLSQFNVIDCDSYGVPDKQIRALYQNPTLTQGTVIIYTAISNKMSGISREVIREYNLAKIYKKSKTLLNGLTLSYFYDLLYKKGVRKVVEYETRGHYVKKYGFFIVTKL